MIEKIHDALRAQGLVPRVEDVHFLACSTDYRTKMRDALSEFEDTADLKHQLERLQEEFDSERAANQKLESDLRDSRSDFAAAERQVAALTKELGAARLAADLARQVSP